MLFSQLWKHIPTSLLLKAFKVIDSMNYVLRIRQRSLNLKETASDSRTPHRFQQLDLKLDHKVTKSLRISCIKQSSDDEQLS